jgi:hypothetical protein
MGDKKQILFLLFGLFLGCDKLCKRTVSEIITVENKTGREVTLSLCKGRFSGIQQVSIKSQQNGNLDLGAKVESYVRGGSDQCETDSKMQREVGVVLTSQSFNTVKLCHANEYGSHIVVVEQGQSCPEGTQEQTEPIDNCVLPTQAASR